MLYDEPKQISYCSRGKTVSVSLSYITKVVLPSIVCIHCIHLLHGFIARYSRRHYVILGIRRILISTSAFSPCIRRFVIIVFGRLSEDFWQHGDRTTQNRSSSLTVLLLLSSPLSEMATSIPNTEHDHTGSTSTSTQSEMALGTAQKTSAAPQLEQDKKQITLSRGWRFWAIFAVLCLTALLSSFEATG